MRKSLPLLAGAIVVPLLAATVAAFAAAGSSAETPAKTAPTFSSSSSSTASATLEAPVQLATPPQVVAVQQTTENNIQQAPAVVLADDPETPSTVTETPTATVPPNQWQTPEPTTSPPASPIPTGGPIEMTISWDGLKCARPDAWSVQAQGGTKMMCPGSANP